MRREFVVKEGVSFGGSQSAYCNSVMPLPSFQGSQKAVKHTARTFFRTHARERYGRVWTLLRSQP